MYWKEYGYCINDILFSVSVTSCSPVRSSIILLLNVPTSTCIRFIFVLFV